jgi:hypothetical protein
MKSECKDGVKTKTNSNGYATLFYKSLDLGVYNPSPAIKRNLVIKTATGKKKIIVKAPEVPDVETDTTEELQKFSIKCKIAVIKSVIFAGYITLAALIGTGAMSLSIPDIGKIIIANPSGVGVGIAVEFMFSFFTRMAQELKIPVTANETTN